MAELENPETAQTPDGRSGVSVNRPHYPGVRIGLRCDEHRTYQHAPLRDRCDNCVWREFGDLLTRNNELADMVGKGQAELVIVRQALDNQTQRADGLSSYTRGLEQKLREQEVAHARRVSRMELDLLRYESLDRSYQDLIQAVRKLDRQNAPQDEGSPSDFVEHLGRVTAGVPFNVNSTIGGLEANRATPGPQPYVAMDNPTEMAYGTPGANWDKPKDPRRLSAELQLEPCPELNADVLGPYLAQAISSAGQAMTPAQASVFVEVLERFRTVTMEAREHIPMEHPDAQIERFKARMFDACYGDD